MSSERAEAQAKARPQPLGSQAEYRAVRAKREAIESVRHFQAGAPERSEAALKFALDEAIAKSRQDVIAAEHWLAWELEQP